MSLELVLVVPVLVLLTVFVLWAGRGGRAALTADLAAEEAVTAAALCCEEEIAGEAGREALVEDMLEARPGLGFLCIGGPRPNAGDGSGGFLSEEWVKFEPGREVGGVGVLGVRFLCESDGAVAPLRGVFPTVTFHGQAAEVVQRESKPSTGFTATRFPVTEEPDPEPLVFTVSVHPTPGEVVTLTYKLDLGDTTAEPEDFGVSDFAALDAFGLGGLDGTDLVGTVEIAPGEDSAEIRLPLVDDGFYEGDEVLVLELIGALPLTVQLDDDRIQATGVIEDDDRKPLLQILPPDPEVDEGGAPDVPDDGDLVFRVRLGGDDGLEAANDVAVTVRVSTVADPAAAEGLGCATWMDSADPCGWASPNDDYVAVSAQLLEFPAGVQPDGGLTLEVPVRTVDDKASPEGEPTEVVVLELSDALGAPVRQGYGLRGGRILDDEATLTAVDASTVEGNDPDAFEELVFELRLDRAPAAPVVVEYELLDDMRSQSQGATAGSDCAVAGTDYLLWDDPVNPGEFTREGTVTIDAGVQQASIAAVRICGDRLVEHEETFRLEVAVVRGEAIEVPPPDDGGAWGTILNDDDVPVVSIEPAQAEGLEGQDELLVFTVRLSGRDLDGNVHTVQIIEDITVDYTIGGYGTDPATAPDAPDAPDADFAVTLDTATPAELSGSTLEGRLTFTAGTPVTPAVTEHVFAVQLLPDYLPEVRETLRLDLHHLNDPTGAAVFEDTDGDLNTDDSFAVGTIEDDAPPELSVSGFTGPEGSDESFTVTLDNARDGEEVTVDYEITGGTGTGQAAPPGSAHPDFCVVCDPLLPEDVLSGTLIFPDGTDVRTVGVSLLRDTEREDPETLTIALSNAGNAYLDSAADSATATGTIDDVDPPYLFVGNTEAREGVPLMFTVALCNPIDGQVVEVDYKTVERSAKAGLAFDPVAGTLTFSAALESQKVTEGEEEECGAGVTADAKLLPVQVTTFRDGVEESDQEVHLVLSGQTPASVGLDKSIGVGRIINVSAATVRVSDPIAVEGDSLGFTISLVDNDGNPAVTPADVTVFYATSDRTATAVDDYTPVPATPGLCLADTAPPPSCPSVTFAPNSLVDPSPNRRHTVPVQTTADTEDEDDETMALILRLADTVDAGLGDTEGTGTIEDADPPAIRISDAAAPEGDSIAFEVTLVDADGNPATTSEDVTVFADTEDGTATAVDDYTAVSRQPLSIPAGQTSPAVDLVVGTVLDAEFEGPETFKVVLSGARNAKIDRAVAEGTINPRCVDVDIDDADNRPPTFTVQEQTVTEGEPIGPLVAFSRPLCEPFYMDHELLTGGVWGTANRLYDYRWGAQAQQNWEHPSAWSVRPNQLRTNNTVLDDLDEDDEWLTVRWRWGSSMPTRYGREWVAARVTIEDDDPLPRLSVADASADEGDPMTFEVTLTPASGRTVTVQYRTTDGSAVAGTDYDQVPATSPGTWTTIEFEPGTFYGATPTSATFTVQTHADADDVDDTFWVELRAMDRADPDFVPVNALIDDGVAVGTILEGDLPEMRIRDARADEGEVLAFVVELSEAASQPVTVSYETVSRPPGSRSATAGVDYTPPAAGASLTFAVGGPLTQTIDVAALDDGVEPEADETFLVELSGAVGASLADPSAVGTINGDVTCVDLTPLDSVPPPVTVTSPGAGEGDGEMTFTVRLSEPVCERTTLDSFENLVSAIEVANVLGYEAAGRGSRDFILASSRLVVQPLVDEFSFQVGLIDDDIAEPHELIVLYIGWGSPFWEAPATATGVIFDNDVANLRVVGDSGPEGGILNFVIRSDRPSSGEMTVGYATEDASPVSAEAGTDYRARSDTAVIAAGDLSATVSVQTLADDLDEDAETFQLRLRNPTGGASLADANAVATGTIDEDADDVPPSLRVSDASVDEGETLEFAVTLDAPSGRVVSVPVVTRDGSARAADGDYVVLASSARVVFAPGELSATVSVQTLADSVVESAETVFVDLGTPANATVDVGIGRGVIRDTSDRRLSVSDASVDEGGTLAFEVGFVEGPSSRDVTVRYRTRAGTATAGDDYDDGFESAPRQLRIVAGDTSATVSVSTVWDTLDEDNESLELVLSDPQGAVIVAGSASGTIIDDDPLPELRVSNTEASEGVGASAVFTLSLSEASGRDVTVAYSTADGTAVAGSDYIAPAAGAMETITAGSTTATVSVPLVNDDVAEEVETFRLVVSSAVNASRGDSVGVATVTDDDGLVQILVDDPAAVYEGDGASAVFTVRLSRAHPTEAVNVDFATADGTAIAGDDYTHTSDTLTFAATETVKTVSVALINDDVAEPAETFGLVLSSPGSNAELGDGEATVLIRDDDGLPTVSVTDAATRTEGATASFTVTLSRAVPQEVTVDYATRADPTAAAETAAVAGQDYTTTSGTVTFAARATEATVTVPLPDDALDEHTETFWLRLNSPVGATIADGTATGTIADDDPLPEITIADAAATEAAPLSFEVRLTPFSGRTVTVPWTTEARPPGAGAASPGTDYTAASGTLTLAPGTTTAQVDVATLPDDVSEADETFLVHLGTPTNAALDDSTASGVIFDDDGLPRVFIADTTVNEDDGPAIFTVTLTNPSSQPVTVKYNTADGTAEDPDDYAPDLERTLTIPATFTAGEISVFVADDDLTEGTETFTITLTDPVNAVIAEGAGTATGTILDNEGQPQLTVADAAECETGSSLADCEVRYCRVATIFYSDEAEACWVILGAPGACQPGMCSGDGTIDFAVRLSHASSEETSVRYTTFDGDAASSRDYIATTATLTIPAGATSAVIPVPLIDDAIPEQEVETFLLRLDDPVGVELATEEAVGTIRDGDPPPVVPAESFDAFSNENDGFAYHRVTLSYPSDLTVTVDYAFEAVLDRSPFAGIDATPGMLTFAPGVVEQILEVPLFDNNVATYDPMYIWPYSTTSYRINLSDRVNATGYGDAATGVVWDDETPPYVDSVAAQDTLEGAGAATFTIALNRFSDTAVTATYQTVDGTAAAGSDYTAADATVTFPPGTMTAAVTVEIIDDTEVESDESFTLEIIDDPRNSNLTYLAQPLAQAGSADRGIGFGSVLILDDDTLPEVSVADIAANEDAGTMTFWVSLSRASATDVTVRYATTDVTATAGPDYTAADDTLTIPAGATGASVSVTIIDDIDDTESDETFTLNLSGATGATITGGSTTATATIIEDANLPIITFRDASRSENLTQTSRFLYFSHELSEQAPREIRVDWQVVEVPSLGDGAATIGADFLASPDSGEFYIFSGTRSGSNWGNIDFEIVADTVPERDERFQVIWSNPRGATLVNTRVWGTILNDDVPIVSVADVEASESDDAVVFTLQLHEPGLDPASLDYTTVVRPSEGDRAASPGDDYTTASGTLNIPAGDTTATISVPIIGDTADEADETFLLVLHSPENLEFRDRVAVGTITDDDDGHWIRDRSVWENAGTMDFTVQRDHTSASPVTVDYRIGTGGSAVGGTACTDGDGNYIADYVTPSGTVTMAAAATTATINIEICDDDDAEGRENLLVELTGVNGRQTIAVGTIVDNERTDLPRINIGDSASRTETLHDTLGTQFQITADRILRGDVTVTWQTEDCLATDTLCPHPATAGTDYTAAGGTVTLTSTNPSATATVTVLNDTTDEDNEQFFVRITDVTDPAVIGTGATHADPVGIGRITDDDGEPTLYVRDSCAVEGEVARILVVLSHAHTSSIYGRLRVVGGTATIDDIGRIGVLDLAARDTTETIEIQVIQDNIPEGTETLELELEFSVSGIERGDVTATLTIREDSCD